MEVVYSRCAMLTLSNPYVPGYGAFRESAPLVELVTHQMEQQPEHTPDVLMVDGNGVLHPRQFGVACHIGLSTGLPTLGVAKNLHQIDQLAISREEVKAKFRTDPSLNELPLKNEAGDV